MRSPLPGLVSDYWSQYLALLGLLALFRFLKASGFHLAWMIRTYAPFLYRPYNYPKIYGDWAAVTGCTAGIGQALAFEIAKRGINVVLVSRSKDKLKSLAQEIENKYKVKTKIIINDAANRDSSYKMAKELEEMDIGILVNNVGINFEDEVKHYNENRIEWVYDTLTVNAGNSAMTTRYVVPNMVKARRGIVVNVCSSSSYVPVPLQSLYSATKVYKDVLTRALGMELGTTGVTAQSICPLLVQSNMTQATSDIVYKFLSISGETYARSSINLLGTCKRTGGHWIFDITYGVCLLILNPTIAVYLLAIVVKNLK